MEEKLAKNVVRLMAELQKESMQSLQLEEEMASTTNSLTWNEFFEQPLRLEMISWLSTGMKCISQRRQLEMMWGG